MNIRYDIQDLNEENQRFFYEMTPYISSHIGKIEKRDDSVILEVPEEHREEVVKNCDRLKK